MRVSHPGLRADARAFHLRAFGDTAARDVCPVRRPVGASFFLIPYAIELQPVGPATSYCAAQEVSGGNEGVGSGAAAGRLESYGKAATAEQVKQYEENIRSALHSTM